MAEGAFGEIDTGRIERHASPHIFATSELASAPTESIDASGPWYDVEEGCYVDEPAPRSVLVKTRNKRYKRT
jgi:hypothetical protein